MLKSKTTNIGIKEAINELKTVNLKDYLRARYEMRQRAIRDQNAREEYVRDEGRAEGHAKGSLDTKRTDILEILEEYGDVSDLLKQRIMSEEDMNKLKNWHRLAAKVDCTEAFEEQINSKTEVH